MEVLGYIAAILIGISLGMIGSGGSILTVPVLVYLMHINPLVATTSSLFIVGITSLVGAFRAYSKKNVEFIAVTEFGIPSIFSIFITRHYILPAIPAQYDVAGLHITKEMLLMVVFAILMLIASFSIMKNRENVKEETRKHSLTDHKPLPLMLLGLGIGVVTGLLGAGGGFIIIPSLLFFLRLPMKTAVGTSLFIIAVNSLFGFLFSLKQFEYNWVVLILFTLLAIAGIFIGGKLSDKVSDTSLRKGFGWFVLIMAVFIIVKEMFWH